MKHVLAKTILISQTIELIAKEYRISIDEARNKFYESNVIPLLDDDETGLYGESAYYLLSLYENYLEKYYCEIRGDNYIGSYHCTRYACRGIVIKDEMMLLSYETKQDFWMIPGGGRENGESNEDCVIRELSEETGYIVVPEKEVVKVVEYYGDVRYVSFYFLCKIVGETNTQLTEAEKEGGLERRWIPFKEALSIFSKHKQYEDTYEEKRGTYLREYTALKKCFETRI